ncbi:MAG: M1 family metallopeptidase [Gemmatimonadota bacterium]
MKGYLFLIWIPTLAGVGLAALPQTPPEHAMRTGSAAVRPGPPVGPPSGPSWQQDVHYTIQARLEEKRQVLRGAATLEYRNHSPDTLRQIFLHLYLNAFRPHSLWARTEKRPRYDFAKLRKPDFGFEHLLAARVDGRELARSYPGAPDSTVVRLALPAPLPPGGALRVNLEWESRPATLCRRQCRGGRHWDFAQWYPRIAVYDRWGWEAHPLYPQGEFYGEFGTYDVTLDVASDQVIGATGVPLEGDPGWRPAPGSPLRTPRYQRSFYPAPQGGRSPGLLAAAPAAGRKRVRFYAENVHHFAWSADPAYRYEGGYDAASGVAVHVLYRPGDEPKWGDGIAVRRTLDALSWLASIFGSYPYPQLTNLHRLEGGGTEFPMVIMNGGASEGLITHEGAHQYAHAILANNEWKQAWLDEGMATFLTNWRFESRGGGASVWRRARESAAAREKAGATQPVATRSEAFVDFATYGAMSYTKPSLIYRMLREYLGEPVFRRALHSYYERYRFHHVSEAGFRSVMEETSGRDLGWFFDQWLHTTKTLDYSVAAATSWREPDGRWRTRVEVVRSGEAWMPVTLRVGSEARTLASHERRQVVEVVSAVRPDSVVLDPDGVLLDADPSNDRRAPRDGS